MLLAVWVPFALWRQGREALPVALLQFVGGAILGLVVTYLTIRLPDAAALVVFLSLVVVSAVLLTAVGGAMPAGIGFGMGPAWLHRYAPRSAQPSEQDGSLATIGPEGDGSQSSAK
jgi:hypothetical protein